ncbi:hypothetical protein NUBL1866_52010 [Klebsiella pneumoniae]|nr:hypothetical protein NUBL1866_52010 [Klebsiella pneumoniae]
MKKLIYINTKLAAIPDLEPEAKIPKVIKVAYRYFLLYKEIASGGKRTRGK